MIYANIFVLLHPQIMRIGIFDSGYGGLTILNEIRRLMPEYDYLYLGDNARAPYGTHSFETIYQYTLQAVKYLFAHDCALVILACNTASAKALRTIQQRDLPIINAEREKDGNNEKVNVLGVIRPTVEAVPEITQTGHIGILATPATVNSESYVLELEKIKKLFITQTACPLWVPLIEAGEHLNSGADYFVDLYLSRLLHQDPQIDTIILGCTHYPLLLPKIQKWLKDKEVSIISQGALVANSLKDYLARHEEYRSQLTTNGQCAFLTTEDPEHFQSSARRFAVSGQLNGLPETDSLTAEQVHLAD